jgi:hypothetical protein
MGKRHSQELSYVKTERERETGEKKIIFVKIMSAHGCQMVYFQTNVTICVNFGGPRNGNVGMPIMYMAIWNILHPIGKFYEHLVI